MLVTAIIILVIGKGATLALETQLAREIEANIAITERLSNQIDNATEIARINAELNEYIVTQIRNDTSISQQIADEQREVIGALNNLTIGLERHVNITDATFQALTEAIDEQDDGIERLDRNLNATLDNAEKLQRLVDALVVEHNITDTTSPLHQHEEGEQGEEQL